MRKVFIIPVLAAALAGCGSVHDRGGCGASTDCPVGQYCAHTSDGNVCWADAAPPSISGVSVACADPVVDGSTCLRDGVLHVRATIADDHEVLGAEVQLDVGGAPVPLVRGAGAQWTADVRLAAMPFDFFEHAVVTTVVAVDGARNRAFEPAVATTVTRHRFARALDTGVFSLGHPAVMQDGTVAVAGTNARVYFLTWDATGVATNISVGSGPITAAPLVSGTSVWLGSEDNNVYKVSTSQSGWTASSSKADTGGPIRGALGLLSSAEVIAASDSGVLYAVTESTARNSVQGIALTAGPVVDPNDHFFGIASGTVRRLQGGIPTDDWISPAVMGGNVADPVACTTALIAVVNTGTEGVVKRLSASADAEIVGTAALPAGGVSVLADGSILVPEQTKTVSRWTSTGAAFPGWQKPDLGGATRTPLITTSAAPFLVPTAKGALYALRSNGSVAWSGQLSAGTASLQPGNIYTRPLQTPGQELSTAYFAGSDGVLHAVIVDGALDASAPWPKAFHDPRNTNRAGAQP